MTMRDLQRLEKLSSTVALGLWADDVVLALDRAITSGRADEVDARLLRDAADMLDEAGQRVSQPLLAPKSARALAATDTTLTAVAALAREQAIDELQMLNDLAALIRGAARGDLSGEDTDRLQIAVTLFGLIGEQQLVESNAVLTSRKHMRPWMAQQTISSFS